MNEPMTPPKQIVIRLHYSARAYHDEHGDRVFCIDKFRQLMNMRRPARRIWVTFSRVPIKGAAKVPLVAWSGGEDQFWDWFDWDGNAGFLTDRLSAICNQLFPDARPGDERTVWVDYSANAGGTTDGTL